MEVRRRRVLFAALLFHAVFAGADSGPPSTSPEPLVGRPCDGCEPASDGPPAEDAPTAATAPPGGPGEPQRSGGPPPLPDPLAAGWNGVQVCELLSQTDRLRALRCTFPPGVGHERHMHVPHFGYALSGGRVRISDDRGTREVELATGSSFTSAGGAHEVVNVGTTTIVYLIVEPR
jgi:hypothetical protein